MMKITCPRCNGERGEYIRDEEGFGPLEWHSCYHCCEEGTIEIDEEVYLDEINMLADEDGPLADEEAFIDRMNEEAAENFALRGAYNEPF